MLDDKEELVSTFRLCCPGPRAKQPIRVKPNGLGIAASAVAFAFVCRGEK